MIQNEMRVIDLSVGQLREMLRAESSIQKITEKENSPKILKRIDVAKLFSVSLVTLTKWVKTGKIPQHTIGSRRFFIESEVMEALNSNLKVGGRSNAKK